MSGEGGIRGLIQDQGYMLWNNRKSTGRALKKTKLRGIVNSFFSLYEQGRTQDFSKREVTFVKGEGVAIHCLISKICELGACFLYFYVLAQNGE